MTNPLLQEQTGPIVEWPVRYNCEYHEETTEDKDGTTETDRYYAHTYHFRRPQLFPITRDFFLEMYANACLGCIGPPRYRQMPVTTQTTADGEDDDCDGCVCTALLYVAIAVFYVLVLLYSILQATLFVIFAPVFILLDILYYFFPTCCGLCDQGEDDTDIYEFVLKEYVTKEVKAYYDRHMPQGIPPNVIRREGYHKALYRFCLVSAAPEDSSLRGDDIDDDLEEAHPPEAAYIAGRDEEPEIVVNATTVKQPEFTMEQSSATTTSSRPWERRWERVSSGKWGTASKRGRLY